MRVASIEHIKLENPVPVYDVIQAVPNHNFLIKAKSAYVCSHN